VRHIFAPRELPDEFTALTELALDMRWTWNHAADALWQAVDRDTWSLTENPWYMLQNVTPERVAELVRDRRFTAELQRVAAARRAYLDAPGWFGETYPATHLRGVAYFSMEFGIGEALPLYAGGLGVLAGDYLKTASDLGVPAVGVGLLYQEGYFRQLLDSEGVQHEAYPYNEPASLPVQPVVAPSGEWLRLRLEFPGRVLQLRAWQATVGRVTLYLLDSNDPLNSPTDRSITGALYGGGPETRLAQEIVLGIGGWRLLETLGLPIDVCHLNEGHAAFAVLERARHFMAVSGVSFLDALWATRAGNLFTTHTPVAAGFDVFSPALVEKYFPATRGYLPELGISLPELLTLGRQVPQNADEPFNIAYLALRGSAAANGVSRLHGETSRRIFQTLYPRWPAREVPIDHVTNGVHVPSWDSAAADRLWTRACGKERWLGPTEDLTEAVQSITDEELWQLRTAGGRALIVYARARLARHLSERGADPETVAQAEGVLDPDILILGFARRFTGYKRPNLLLQDPERLRRLLTDPARPVQIIVAGKAHPADEDGKGLVRAWLEFIQRPEIRHHAVFLEDYDLSLAQQLVQGVDVWVNTPRRPWEACGTSGMKVLVNGGLNLSELDGWWAEAYRPDAGWALGDGRIHAEPDWDRVEADALYRLLEQDVVPAFYGRDARGIPTAWVARMRASMAALTPRFNGNRMVREYLKRFYLPGAREVRRRCADGGALAGTLRAWHARVTQQWGAVQFGELRVQRDGDRWTFSVPLQVGQLPPTEVRVELYADPAGDEEPIRQVMERASETADGYVYRASVPATRPASHFTPRAMPFHPDVRQPAENSLICWQR
jgi:glycogen phosphorylase